MAQLRGNPRRDDDKSAGLAYVNRAADALEALACYYGHGRHADHGLFTGRLFDTWDSTGTRVDDVNRFTADDVVAVSFLSVQCRPARPRTSSTPAPESSPTSWWRSVAVGDRSLVTETQPWDYDWAGGQLWRALVELPRVGPTTASKLYARRRPRLRPIYDSVVAAAIGSDSLWEPLRALLQSKPGLHPHLMHLHN